VKLYSYWRSTTSFRVRAALNIKDIPHEIVPVNLVEGEQRAAPYLALNPIGGVPTLVLDDGTVLTQSMAILDWLDAAGFLPRLMPEDPIARARVLGAAFVIACDIHPVNNLKVLNYLKERLGHSQDEAVAWMRHWMHEGFTAFNELIEPGARFCFNDEAPDVADLCLAGQMINARRWGLDLAPFPRLVEIDERLRKIPAIAQAMPEAQPDAM
jgi:maleylacetoacetate isomerase/maleylpyruvate isomerase